MRANRLIMSVAAAVGAIVITSAAVTVANAGGNDEVLSQDDVSRELAAESASTTPPEHVWVQPTPLPPGDHVSVERPAGRMVLLCEGDRTWLVGWSPNPGYRADANDGYILNADTGNHGIGGEVSVVFLSDSGDDMLVTAWCEDGQALARDRVWPHGDIGSDQPADGGEDGSGSGG